MLIKNNYVYTLIYARTQFCPFYLFVFQINFFKFKLAKMHALYERSIK